MIISESTKAELIEYAIAKSPLECCGYVLETSNNQEYIYHALNIHDEPREHFAISALDTVRANRLGKIKAVFHSHPNASLTNGMMEFSETDKAIAESLKLPSILIVLPFNDIKIYSPCGYKPPLIGRKFEFGVCDCYSLIRDALLTMDIELKDYPRKNYSELQKAGWDLFEENWAKEGGREVDLSNTPLIKGDVLLMAVDGSRVVNHAGIVWHPEHNPPIFIHHVMNHPSREEEFRGYWERKTMRVIRLKQLWN